MEGLEMHESISPIDESDDFCNPILSRFDTSTQEDHRHLCSVIGAVSQELKDQGLPLTPIAYFGATISSVDRLSNDSRASDPVITALLSLLSMILPSVSVAILRKKRDFVSEPIVRVLYSESVTVGTVVSGLKCISHLLIIVSDKASWLEISKLYTILLSFITHSDDKVRRQSQSCLHDVLRSFQGSAVLAIASEGITNMFEKFLLLAAGSNSTASERPKGAQEVLHILYALKDCLPLMSLKFTTSIIKYFKSLLELRQPIVTKRVSDCLHTLCLYPTSEVSPEALLDLLCSLAASISAHEKSVDGMVCTARLLDVGMRKVYALNRKLCVVKLPLAFNALVEIMTCEHEEALFAAVEALKSLIHACINESLIKQGVDQIMVNPGIDSRRSRPTIIEKICATIESLLGYQYSAVWDMVFQVVSAMFDKLGEYSSHLLRGTIKSLANMQKLSEEDLTCRKQLHACLGSALGAMGPETFLSLMPLNLESEDPGANVWLLPILKQNTVGAHLSFFTKSILGMVALMRQKSRMLEQEGQIVFARSTEALAYSLWSLLPAFCYYPVDTANSFKDLKKSLCIALREEPDVRGIICSSLQILIQQNRKVLEENNNLSHDKITIPEQRARAFYTPQVAADNLNTLKSYAREFFSVLSAVFMQSSKDSRGCLQSTISEFASISDKEVVKRFYKTTMQKLLEVTKEAAKAEHSRNSASTQIDSSGEECSPSLARIQILDLSASLLPGLNVEGVDVLFYAIRPALKDDEGLVQKKAYKILSIILRDRDEFLSTKFEDLLGLMIEALPSCHLSAKRHRLDCLYFLIVHVCKDATEQRKSDIISSFLTEIILALKEVNKKTRNRAYDMLVEVGHACRDENRGGKKEYLQQFFNMIAGGLAGETPYMISAAVKGLARLAYQFSDLISEAYNVLPSAFLLLQRKNIEIIKANLGLLKVLAAKSEAELLQTHLRIMVEGLLKLQDDIKNLFKAKVKHLLEMFVRKCGLEAVKAVMPEEHMKLLTNIQKIKERKERRTSANSEEESRSCYSKVSTFRFSRWNHSKVFSDVVDDDSEGNDAEYMDDTTVSGRWSNAASQSKLSSLRSKGTSRAAKSLPEDLSDQLGDDPLDLLDRQKTWSALRSSGNLKRKPESDDEPEINSEGRLVIREEGKPNKRESPADSDMDVRSQASRHLSTKSSKQTQKKRKKTSETGWAYTGNAYSSWKAGGDVKWKEKLEPYAYWPLDRKMLSGRPEHRAAARKGMASVVKLTKQLEGMSTSSAPKGLKYKRNQKAASK